MGDQKVFNDGHLNKMFGNADLSVLSFMTLSAIPIGGTVDCTYGKIVRKSATDFSIEIASDKVELKGKQIRARVGARDSVESLFEK